MLIQGLGNAAAYAAVKPAAAKPNPLALPPSSDSQGSGTKLTISDQAKAMVASDSQGVQAKLDAIKAKPAVERTSDDTDFLLKNDSRLAQITAKGQKAQTAEDVDYVQKAGGFVNTMANLSPSERKLYDQMVADGNTDAVNGMNLIALSRMGSGDVTLPSGQTFDPRKTEITPHNIRNLFSQMFVSTDGQNARSFDALASYLDRSATQSA
jgi:hypothetical protein